MLFDEALTTNSGLKISFLNFNWVSELFKWLSKILAESIPILYTGCQTVDRAGVKKEECVSSSKPTIEISSGILKPNFLASCMAEIAILSFIAKIASGRFSI